MALSRYEQRALDAIALELYAQDRRLASQLAHDGRLTRTWRQRLAASTLFVVGATMLMCAIFVPHNFIAGMFAVSILGYLVMFAAAMWWCAGAANWFCRDDDGLSGGLDVDV